MCYIDHPYILQRSTNYQGQRKPEQTPKIIEDSDSLWQKWKEAIQPMIDDISRQEIVTEEDLRVMVY